MTAWRHRTSDPIFAKKCADAEQEAADLLEKEAALPKATTNKSFTKASPAAQFAVTDRLLEFLLRGARPEKYRERFILPVAELDKLIERELAVAKSKADPDETTDGQLKTTILGFLGSLGPSNRQT